ncbi:protoporphyrinogen oxidase [bacterium]|nr:protoporphyrinogen oxidase [bacterium]
MNEQIFDVVIVGGGLSGLSTAHFLKKQAPGKNILILEKDSRVGGAIRSMNEQGFLAEWGPHGFLDNVAESRELLSDLAVTDSIQQAPLKQFVRYICLGGKLVQLPQTPPAIIKSNIIPFTSKLRVLADLIRKPKQEEQTVADWATHRFGKAVLPIVDIVFTGTYAGNIDTLSIDAAMPGLRRLEKEYGSVLKGAIKTQRQKKNTSGLPSMVSFKNGMEHLITMMSESANIRMNSPVESITKQADYWTIQTGQSEIKSKQLVLSTHINQALALLGGLAKPPRKSVNEAVVYNVVFGFDSEVKIPFGFGYLAPKSEKRFALGTLFSIHMFPGRAPEGMNIVEVLVGGARNPEFLSLGDDDLMRRALNDIGALIELKNPPVFKKIIKPKVGIPQLELGHLQFLEYRDKLQNQYRGLSINGFGWEGIGMNEMIKQAKETANNLISDSNTPKSPAQAKGIYF